MHMCTPAAKCMVVSPSEVAEELDTVEVAFAGRRAHPYCMCTQALVATELLYRDHFEVNSEGINCRYAARSATAIAAIYHELRIADKSLSDSTLSLSL